ncbi:MAG: SPFH domain-containing protein [Oscillospiraceae bacterium]|nr:SPFH domain-containing protein [Oscillospiraceae bacterium]
MEVFSKAKGMFDVVTGGSITGQTGALIWKYPHNMITSGSVLQVMPGQEAVFYKSGSSGFEILGPGEYPVETKLIPFLQKIMNVPFGKKTPYSTHIWYVNKTTQFDFPWGTREKVRLEDPKYNSVILKVGASGSLQIEVENAAVLFEKVVGTMKEFTLNDLESTLKTIVIADISGILQRYASDMRAKERAREDAGERRSFIDLLGANDVLSEMIKDAMIARFERFGLSVVGCAAQLNVEEDANYKKIESFGANLLVKMEEAEGLRISARARRDELDTLGATYMGDRQMDVMQTFAGNESGSATNLAGVGAGIGMMGVMAGQMQNVMQPMMQQQQPAVQPVQQTPGGVVCPACGVSQNPAKFCMECGTGMDKKCPSCGTSVSPKQKFCNECGSPMEKKCGGCGSKVEIGQKFCNECGQKL